MDIIWLSVSENTRVYAHRTSSLENQGNFLHVKKFIHRRNTINRIYRPNISEPQFITPHELWRDGPTGFNRRMTLHRGAWRGGLKYPGVVQNACVAGIIEICWFCRCCTVLISCLFEILANPSPRGLSQFRVSGVSFTLQNRAATVPSVRRYILLDRTSWHNTCATPSWTRRSC